MLIRIIAVSETLSTAKGKKDCPGANMTFAVNTPDIRM